MFLIPFQHSMSVKIGVQASFNFNIKKTLKVFNNQEKRKEEETNK